MRNYNRIDLYFTRLGPYETGGRDHKEIFAAWKRMFVHK